MDAGTSPCGIPFDGGVPQCGTQAACLCKARDDAPGAGSVPRNVCVTANDICRLDGGTGLMAPDGQCITGVAVGDLVLRFSGEPPCPGYDINDFRPDAGPPDAGRDGGPPDAGRDGGLDAGDSE
jgi:hypothetical protein